MDPKHWFKVQYLECSIWHFYINLLYFFFMALSFIKSSQMAKTCHSLLGLGQIVVLNLFPLNNVQCSLSVGTQLYLEFSPIKSTRASSERNVSRKREIIFGRISQTFPWNFVFFRKITRKCKTRKFRGKHKLKLLKRTCRILCSDNSIFEV